jgi:hypothetical protein
LVSGNLPMSSATMPSTTPCASRFIAIEDSSEAADTGDDDLVDFGSLFRCMRECRHQDRGAEDQGDRVRDGSCFERARFHVPPLIVCKRLQFLRLACAARASQENGDDNLDVPNVTAIVSNE